LFVFSFLQFQFKAFIIISNFFLVSAEKLQEIQSKIDEERKALSKKKGLEEAEKNKIAQNLEKREKELRKAQ
jgi:hypothetical protein